MIAALIVSLTTNIGLMILLILTFKERKDLLNRIMAKDLTEYKTDDTGPPPKGGNFVLRGLRKRFEESG